MPSSLPQDAVLSTTLFSLYLSDIPHTRLTFYPDDPLFLKQPDTLSCALSNAVMTLL